MPSSKMSEATDRKNKNKNKVPEFCSSSPRTTSTTSCMFPHRSGPLDSLGPGEARSRTNRHEEEGLVTAYTLRENDVLFGRGSGPNGFAGNVRYRNLIRSILIKSCNMDDDCASVDNVLPDFFLPDNDQDITISRRNRIWATQVVKAIQSRKGRFLQRVSCRSSSSSEGKRSASVSNHIERVVYKEVEESIAIEKTKQNFRDQMRQLQMEQAGINSTVDSKEEPPEDSWVLPSRNPSTSCLTGGKRKLIDDYSAESLIMRSNKVTRFLSSQEMEIQNDYVLPNRTCPPLPTTTANSYNLLARRSLPRDSFFPRDDILLERVLSQQARPLSQIGDPTRDHGLSYRHFPATTQPLFIQEDRPIVYYNTRPQLLEDHLRFKSNIRMHDPQAFLGKEDLHHSSTVLLSLGCKIGRGQDDTFSHRLVASSPRSTTTLPMSIMSAGCRDGPVAPIRIVTPPAATRTTGQVEAMIASHQTRRDKFWMGWANVSK